jgi:cyclophilin family peptidyl-prolyl cis-trans isomerase
MERRIIIVVALACLLGTVQLLAQPKAASTATKPAARAYQAKLEEWKDMLRKLQSLRASYVKASPNEAVSIRVEWNETITMGDDLLSELRGTAKLAFVESPNEDRQLGRFLMKLIEDATGADRYEIVADLTETMIKNGSDHRILYDYGGIAQFAIHDFEKAEEYFAKAKQLNVLSHMGINYQGEVKDYITFWKEEQEIREQEAAADDLPRVKLVTSKGEIIVELFENEAPETVGNFISLVENGFYEDNVFHRVLRNFVSQAGSADGDGNGGPGYTIYSEAFKPNARKHFRGSLSMAISEGGPNSGNSQFFITFRPTANLNGKHTVFGRVIKGLEILPEIQRINPDEPDPRITPDRILQAEVLRSTPGHVYVPNKVRN